MAGLITGMVGTTLLKYLQSIQRFFLSMNTSDLVINHQITPAQGIYKMAQLVTQTDEPQVELLGRTDPDALDHPPYTFCCYHDINGNKKYLLIPSVDIGPYPGKVREILINGGYSPNHGQKHWKEVMELLQEDTPVRISLSKTPGYIGTMYLRSDGSVIGCNDELGPRLIPNLKIQLPKESQKGRLNEWKQHVAVYAKYSDLLMLSLCLAFGSLLVRFTDIESGGFHVYGSSSIGKSTCLLFAASVFGNREFIQSWAVTLKALEEQAEAHNDSLYILDELMRAETINSSGPKHVKQLSYTISENQGKARSLSYEKKRAVWSLLILSAGEVSLEQYYKGDDLKRMEGETVRLIDLPADAGLGYGIYNSIPDDCLSSSELAKRIKAAIKEYHGTASIEFIQQLLALYKGNLNEISTFINKRIAYFLTKHNVDTNNGQSDRIAEKFGLAYAAGAMCKKLGILDFDRKKILKSISSCYQAHLDSRPLSRQEIMNEQLSKLVHSLNNGSLINLLDLNNSLQYKTINKAIGYITEIKGEPVIAIERRKFDKIFPNESIRSLLIKEIVRLGGVLQSKDQKNTRQVSIPGIDKKPRCYCLRKEFLATL